MSVDQVEHDGTARTEWIAVVQHDGDAATEVAHHGVPFTNPVSFV